MQGEGDLQDKRNGMRTLWRERLISYPASSLSYPLDKFSLDITGQRMGDTVDEDPIPLLKTLHGQRRRHHEESDDFSPRDPRLENGVTDVDENLVGDLLRRDVDVELLGDVLVESWKEALQLRPDCLQLSANRRDSWIPGASSRREADTVLGAGAKKS